MKISLSNEHIEVRLITPGEATRYGKMVVKSIFKIDKVENEDEYYELIRSLEEEYFSYKKNDRFRKVTISMTWPLMKGLLPFTPLPNNKPAEITLFGEEVNEIEGTELICIFEIPHIKELAIPSDCH